MTESIDKSGSSMEERNKKSSDYSVFLLYFIVIEWRTENRRLKDQESEMKKLKEGSDIEMKWKEEEWNENYDELKEKYGVNW